MSIWLPFRYTPSEDTPISIQVLMTCEISSVCYFNSERRDSKSYCTDCRFANQEILNRMIRETNYRKNTSIVYPASWITLFRLAFKVIRMVWISDLFHWLRITYGWPTIDERFQPDSILLRLLRNSRKAGYVEAVLRCKSRTVVDISE